MNKISYAVIFLCVAVFAVFFYTTISTNEDIHIVNKKLDVLIHNPIISEAITTQNNIIVLASAGLPKSNKSLNDTFIKEAKDADVTMSSKDGGVVFKTEVGVHKTIKVLVLISDYNSTTLKNGIEHGWHMDEDKKLTVITIPFTVKGNYYEFYITLSETCVGCYTGTYSQTFTNLSNTSTSTFSQTLTNVSSLTANITDYATTQDDPYVINTSGLVGWWHGDDNWSDSSGNNNNGTLTGKGSGAINYSSCKYNNCTLFNGTTDYVNAGNAASLNMTTAITVEAWINPNNVTQTGEIVGRHTTSSNAGGSLRLNNKNVDVVIVVGGVLKVPVTTTNPISKGTWNHVTYTYNRSNIAIFVNGLNLINMAASGNIATTFPNTTIGSISSGVSEFFNGSIDEVRIYNRSLNASEIQSHYYTHLQQLQITATGNETSSGNWNGTTNNPINISVATNNTITGLTYIVPSSVTINGTIVNDYRNSTKWNLTATAAFTENTTTIAETSASGYYYFNGSFQPTNNSSSGSLNFTINDATFLAATYKGTASFTSNNTNLTGLIFDGTHLNFSIVGGLNKSFLTIWNITIPYNNAPATSIDEKRNFTTSENVTINTSASDPEGNTLSCYVKVNGVEKVSCSQNDFGLQAAGTYTIFYNVTEAATVSSQWVNITNTLAISNLEINISGYVKNTSNILLANVNISCSGCHDIKYATTDAFGYYNFTGMNHSFTTTLTAILFGYKNESVNITYTGNVTNQNFTLLKSGLNLSGYIFNTLELLLPDSRIDINSIHAFNDINGSYTITGLDEGTYMVLVRHIGYVNKSIIISITNSTQYNFTLSESTTPSIVSTPGFEGVYGILLLGITHLYIRRKV